MKTNKPKIDIIVKYFYPVAAGIETNIMETYSVLVKRGWRVTIHTSKDEYLTKNSLADREMIRGMSVRRYPFTSEFLGFMPDIDWQHTSVVALHNFNVYFWKLLLYSLWLKITNKKHFALIVTPHGGFNPEWSMYSFATKLIKIPYHYVLGTALINSVVDKVRAVSEWEKAELIKKGVRRQRIVVIANGIENEAYMDVDSKASVNMKNTVKKLGRYIIQVGRVYPIKNYETTIRALTRIPKDVKYVIVGQEEKSTEYKTSLIELASSLGLSNRVVFLGVVRGIDKYYLIKHAEMMVHMAIWESFCNVVHEGLSQGLVCIVADNTALPYLIRNNVNGYCVETRDSEALAEKIIFVLSHKNSALIKDMQKRNAIYGLTDSWDHVANAMDSLYRALVKNYDEHN